MEPASHIEILLDDRDLILRPGETLRGGWRYNHTESLAVRKAEVFVLWFTEGKGDTDEGTVWQRTSVEAGSLDAGRAFPFELQLPAGPWTYDGRIVKIRWAVRVFVTPEKGPPFAAEERFQLRPAGYTRPAEPAAEPA